MDNTTPNPMAALTRSLIKVQQAVQGAKANKSNPHLKNRYADLGSVWETCRELLATNGLAVTHTFKESSGETMTCVAILLHEDGAQIESSLTMKLVKTDPQAVGSAITYARRYTLASLIGIVVDDDDDGNRSSGTGSPHQQAAPPSPLDGKKKEIRNLIKTAIKGPELDTIRQEAQFFEESQSWSAISADDLIVRLKRLQP